MTGPDAVSHLRIYMPPQKLLLAQYTHTHPDLLEGDRKPAFRPQRYQADMTTSKRFSDHKSAKFQKNVLKRGAVPETNIKKGSTYPVGPVVLGLFVFVVIGSAILQIIRTASSGAMD